MCRKTISTPTGATRRFANDKRGHKALIEWLAETPANRVVFEPTGPYHRGVERALGIAGVPFVKVNPRQARRFAEATGKLAKTDRLDAAILARMGALLELEARPARSGLLFELKELYVARGALVKDRTAAKNRGKALTPFAVEASECSAPRTDRSPDSDSRSGDSPDYRSEREPRRSLRHPDPHSRPIQHHRLCLADRNARNSALSKPDRPPTSQVWRQSPDSQGVGPAALSFEAVAPTSAKRSTCRPSSPPASIRT